MSLSSNKPQSHSHNKNQTGSVPRHSRRYARYFAVQGMYQWLINPSDGESIESYIRFNPVGLPQQFHAEKNDRNESHNKSVLIPHVPIPSTITLTEPVANILKQSQSQKPTINLDVNLENEETLNPTNELKQLKSMFHDHKRDATFLQSDFADGFIMIDVLLFKTLFNGMREHYAKDCDVLQSVLDRPFAQLSVVEKAVLLLGTFELLHMDTPYKVVINEAVDLCKTFGSGQRYVNGVLDNLAQKIQKKV
jgi:transcription termination factor NusB